jgi:transcriptional regulator GlxA family with amidase domain
MSVKLDRRTVVGAVMAAGVLPAAAATVAAPNIAEIRPLPTPTDAVPVAILMDESATMIDFAGPWEAFQDASVTDVKGFKLYTVAPSAAPFQTTGYMEGGVRRGMKVIPDYTFADAPQPRVVVMGAQSRRYLPEKLDWIRKVAPGCDIVMSVCTGAFILAKTGLLDGLSATTHHDFYDSFEKEFGGKVTLLKGRRFVDNGKFVTAGGLTSGVDGALHVVARYYGVDAARASAAYMEHHGDGWLSGLREA